MRCLEEDVICRVTCGEFLVDFGGQIIVQVLRFPVAAREPEFVINEHAVDNDGGILGRAQAFLTDKREIILPCVVLEERPESRSDCAFVCFTEVFVLRQFGVKIGYRFMRWFNGNHSRVVLLR